MSRRPRWETGNDNRLSAVIYKMAASTGLMTTQLKLFSHPKVIRSVICGMQVHFLRTIKADEWRAGRNMTYLGLH